MLGLTRNAVLGLNLYCGGAGLAAGGPGAHPPAAGVTKGAKEPREAERRAASAPEARPAPLGAEAPDAPDAAIPEAASAAAATATPARGWLFHPGRCVASPAPEENASAAMLSPEEELDGDEPDAAAATTTTTKQRPAGLPLALPALRLAASASGANADGSLPPTPPPADEEEPEGDGDGDADKEGDALYRLSLDIISRYLREQASGRKDAAPGPAGRRALDTLRRVGDGVQRNHRTAFQGMLRKLELKGEADVQALSRVMAHVFSDGVTNWGRVVTLIAFGAFVAKHLHSTGRERCVEPLARSIADVLVGTKRDWLVQQRGWDGFVEFFHVEDLEGGIRNVLLAFAGVAGVGAGLAYLIR